MVMDKEKQEELTKLCKDLEHFETDAWCMPKLLEKEILTKGVVDAGCGTGVLSIACENHDNCYDVESFDIKNWGYDGTIIYDFLKLERGLIGIADEFSVVMNPPFSLATQFVKKAFELGARKVVVFQRLSWYESKKRRAFFEKNPPSRIWACGDRATCWRHDLPVDEKGNRYDPKTGKKLSGTSTAHAFFVWERSQKGTQIGHIYKNSN